ncbi:hypothetical protein [Streptomyces tailanensis]|uniref:hypothetical protein n=1 Tax=Streptomyces tailanensis TaxID=2569858 RepID=UPI001C0EA169|nr:hypothetical protein [Streptomyces tailanensis]
MARQHGRKRALRTIAPPFTVAAPSGARIRDRLRVDVTDEKVLTLVGQHLGRHQRVDLAERVAIGPVPMKDNRRAERKKKLTAVSSSRWAGAMTRASEDQYQLSMRCLYDERAALRHAIEKIARRLAVPCGQRTGRVRGYQDRGERFQKHRRLQALKARLAVVEQHIAEGRPSVVVGGRRLAKTRHNLADAQLTAEHWRKRWDAARLFLTADGESGAPHGNYTITVDPADGGVTIVLPESLRHLANAPRGRYRLACTVTFHHRRQEWLDRACANQAVRYDIVHDPIRGRWYLEASWSSAKAMVPSPQEIRAAGGRMLAVDLNADLPHARLRSRGGGTPTAAHVLDPHGNPVGEPITVPLELTGSASRRDGRLRAAVTSLIGIARTHDCAGIAVENLGFTDARQTGRETMGRGRRGKVFRRTVAGIPTASSGIGCAAWPTTEGWSWSPWTRPTPHAGAPYIGEHPSTINQRPLSPGITRPRWQSADAAWDNKSGVGQV